MCLQRLVFSYNSTMNAFENLTNGIISSLLIDGPTSPFYQALIEPNIGSDYSPATGLAHEFSCFSFL